MFRHQSGQYKYPCADSDINYAAGQSENADSTFQFSGSFCFGSGSDSQGKEFKVGTKLIVPAEIESKQIHAASPPPFGS